jgi:hypothetical protein
MPAVVVPGVSLEDLLVTEALRVSHLNLLPLNFPVYERRSLLEDREDFPRVDERQNVTVLCLAGMLKKATSFPLPLVAALLAAVNMERRF